MSTIFVDIRLPRDYVPSMLSPEQSRAARGWLDWSQDELAKRANVSLSTVRDFEKGRRIPIANNLDALRRAIEAGGVQLVFTDGLPAGVSGPSDQLGGTGKAPGNLRP